MVDINKLRYDLAMNCALAFVLDQKKNSDFNYRSAMAEAFEGYYYEFGAFDSDRLLTLLDNMNED